MEFFTKEPCLVGWKLQWCFFSCIGKGLVKTYGNSIPEKGNTRLICVSYGGYREPLLFLHGEFILNVCISARITLISYGECFLTVLFCIWQIDTLTKVNHKNFTNLLGYCKEEETFTRMMVFEYASNGTLFEHIHGKLLYNFFYQLNKLKKSFSYWFHRMNNFCLFFYEDNSLALFSAWSIQGWLYVPIWLVVGMVIFN